MSWLRIDDGYSRHPKIVALTYKERAIWMDVLCYCARYQTGGFLPENCGEVVSGATIKFLARCSELGLVNVVGKRLRVHDWHVYNGTVDERVDHYLRENPDASANEVFKAVGGNREQVLAAVRKRSEGGTGGIRSAGTTSGTGTGTYPSPSPSPEDLELSALPREEPEEGHEEKLWKRLCIAAGARSRADTGKLERTVKSRGSTEREIQCAIEAATGQGVRDPLAVALSELVKRSDERRAA